MKEFDSAKCKEALYAMGSLYKCNLNDPKRFKALLRDLMPGHALEVNVIMLALETGIFHDCQSKRLTDASQSVKHIKMLTDEYGVQQEYAQAVIRVILELYRIDVQSTKASIADKNTGNVIQPKVPAEDFASDYEFSEVENGIRIDRFIGFEDEELTIPGIIDGKPVVEIGPWAFQGLLGVHKIIVPEGVLILGNGAFKDCKELKEIQLPSTLRQIGTKENKYIEGVGVFWGTSLSSIEIPDAVTYIGKNSFWGLKLKEIRLPNELTEIDNWAFDACECLSKVIFPNGLNIIGTSAFNGCKSLKEIRLNEGLKFIGDGAFKGCSGLEVVYIPNSVRRIGKDAFAGWLSWGVLKLRILCHAGSYAQQYAREKGIKCEKA